MPAEITRTDKVITKSDGFPSIFNSHRANYQQRSAQEAGYNIRTVGQLLNGRMPAETIDNNLQRIGSIYYEEFPNIKILDGPGSKNDANAFLYQSLTDPYNANFSSSLNSLLAKNQAALSVIFMPRDSYPQSFNDSFGQNMDVTTSKRNSYLAVFNQGKLSQDNYKIVVENELREIRDNLKAKSLGIDTGFIATREYQVASLVVSHLKGRTDPAKTYNFDSIVKYANEIYEESLDYIARNEK